MIDMRSSLEVVVSLSPIVNCLLLSLPPARSLSFVVRIEKDCFMVILVDIYLNGYNTTSLVSTHKYV